MCVMTMLWTRVHHSNEAECFATHWRVQHTLSSSSRRQGSIHGFSLRATLLLTVLNSMGSCGTRRVTAIASAYLKQVKDAIAEAYNKHASSRMIVNCRDLCSSLIEEVLGPQSPPSSCTHQTTNQSCTSHKLSKGLSMVAGKAASAAQALLATLGSDPCILSFCMMPNAVVYAVYNHPVA